jgi:hypothetical protein
MAAPTPYPDLNEVLGELVAGARAVLGEDLVAACLQGSFAVGDFDEHSDVDWVVAIRKPLGDARSSPSPTRSSVLLLRQSVMVSGSITTRLSNWWYAAVRSSSDMYHHTSVTAPSGVRS